MLIIVSAIVIIIALIICAIAIQKKNSTPENDNRQPQSELSADELLQKQEKQQEEELKKQDEELKAHDEATVEASEINENGEATLHIINEEAGIDEELVIHDATQDANGGIHGIDENGEAVYYDPSDNIKDESQEDGTNNESNITEDKEATTNEQTDSDNAGETFPGFGEVAPDGGTIVEPEDPDPGWN